MIDQEITKVKCTGYYRQEVQHIVDSQQIEEQIDELKRHVI